MHKARHERLFFWRLGFYPTYSGEEVESRLLATLQQAKIKSAVCYELFGPYDLLLRVWLPDGKYGDVDEFQNLLIENLGPADLSMCDPFLVSKPARHWVFPADDKGEIPTPNEDDIAALSDDQIAEVENEEVSATEVRRLEAQHLLADLNRSPETTDPRDPGIKFAIVVGADLRMTTRQQRKFLQTLTQKLDEAEEELDESERGLGQRSLYSGSGFGHFLIMGRVTNQAFFRLGSELLDKINEADIHDHYNGRTYTHISVRREFLVFTESLVKAIETKGRTDKSDHQEQTFSSRPGWPFRRRGEPGLAGSEELFAGKFKLGKELGRGAFSVVYEATDFVEGPMAVKIIDSPGSFDRVRREVAVLRMIRHPNVVQVYSTGRTDDQRFYIASELVKGTVVQEFVEDPDKRLADEEAVRLVGELLSALISIHPDETRIEELRSGEMSPAEFTELQGLQEAGFVHRDVKPSNMILSDAGVLKLFDFNIASSVGDPVVTQSGTGPYQPPDASFDSWDVGTDLFAAGVVLYQLLTCEHPYKRMQPRADEDPRDPRVFRPELSPALGKFLLRATGPRGQGRFASAKEMQAALESAWRQTSLETEADHVGSRLRDLREAQGLSIQELAKKAGLDSGLLEETESGQSSPTLTTLRMLARALDISLARVLGEWD